MIPREWRLNSSSRKAVRARYFAKKGQRRSCPHIKMRGSILITSCFRCMRTLHNAEGEDNSPGLVGHMEQMLESEWSWEVFRNICWLETETENGRRRRCPAQGGDGALHTVEMTWLPGPLWRNTNNGVNFPLQFIKNWSQWTNSSMIDRQGTRVAFEPRVDGEG